MIKAKFTLYGTSASVGVPVIGCSCPVCSSKSSYNKRLRPAAMLEVLDKKYLIDAGPDVREQALKHHLKRLDGVFLTHTHFDHIAGIDDLRVFSFIQKGPIPCFMSNETFDEMKIRYHYLFDEDLKTKPKFTCRVLEKDHGHSTIDKFPFTYFSYFQTGMKITGLRFGNLAYMTDIKEYDASIFDYLMNLDTLIISAIDWTSTRAHLGIDNVVEIIEKIKPKKVFITHIGHELEYEVTSKQLPSPIKLAYDGLILDLELTLKESN